MSRQIWKYPLLDLNNVVEMPWKSQLLCVQMQGDTLTLWVLVNPDTARIEGRLIDIYGTGQNIPDDPGAYLGSVQMGSLVFHAFDNGVV